MTDHKDFLGSPYDVGDNIIYAAMSGRSVTMVAARVVKFNESGSVSVQPLKSSRWKQHMTKRTRYIDKRTGKGIEPYAASGKHIAEREWCEDKRTGEHIPDENLWPFKERDRAGYYYSSRTPNPNYVPYEQRTHHRTKFKDYVEQVTEDGAKPVTLCITDNIVKWDGVIPDESIEANH